MGVRTSAARVQALDPRDETLRGTYWFDLNARHPAAAWAKRAIDVTIAALLIVLLAPLVLSKRKVERRIGFRGNAFEMYLSPLAQLLNVLEGTMSLVGPRAFAPDELDQVAMGSRMRRFSVHPGITGLWRVRAGDESLLDREYINDWSLGLDLKILARTLFR
jgi:lipopolysaccharide/colanic/teichoic acid biosynthesis glycosyltransferase